MNVETLSCICHPYCDVQFCSVGQAGFIGFCFFGIYSLLSYVGSTSKVCQPLHCIIICRVQSGQTAILIYQMAWVNNVRHCLGLGHKSTGPTSLLDTICFYRRHRAETIQQRPLLLRKVETRLSDCGGQPLSRSWQPALTLEDDTVTGKR